MKEIQMRVSGRHTDTNRLTISACAVLDGACGDRREDIVRTAVGEWNGITSIYLSCEAAECEPSAPDIEGLDDDVLVEMYVADPEMCVTSYAAYYGGANWMWENIGWKRFDNISLISRRYDSEHGEHVCVMLSKDDEMFGGKGYGWPYTPENIVRECGRFNNSEYLSAIIGVPAVDFISGDGLEHCFGNDRWFELSREWFRPRMELLMW